MANITNLCTPYLRQADGRIKGFAHEIFTDFIPAAGLVTTAEDLMKWNILLHNGKLLGTDFYTKMTTATATRNHPIFGDVPYGYALQMARGEPYEIGHGGYAPGFASINFYYPKEKLSLIVLENLDWQAKDMKENFWFETAIRELVRLEIGR
jgi:CubicO group peptidase (beta-lactamase class C family)